MRFGATGRNTHGGKHLVEVIGRTYGTSSWIRGDAALLAVATVLVLFFIGYPILTSLRIFELSELVRLFRAENLPALQNSVLLAVLTVPLSLAIGVPLAWLCTRTNLPWRGTVSLLVSTAFVMPILLTAISYVFLFGPNSGLVNSFYAKHFGGEPLYDIFSYSGIVLVSVFQSYPLIFLAAAAGLANMNPELEDTARVAGLRPAQVFWRISFGAITPSIMAGVIMCVALTLTMVSGPIVLGVPVGIPFLTTEIYAAVSLRPNLARALALGIPLVLVTVAAIWLQSRIVGDTTSRFAMISGKGQRGDLIDLGKWRIPLLALCMVPIFLSLLLPLGALLIASFMEFWWKGFVWTNLYFGNFRYVLTQSVSLQALGNTLILSIGVGVFLAFVSGALAAVMSGTQTVLKRTLSALIAIPLGLPALVAGVLIILAWFGRPFQLGGTMWILAFGYVLVMLPYALRTTQAAFAQIDVSLTEAARVCGCSPLQSWRHVLFPLMGNGLFATFVMVFLFTIKEFPLTVLAYSVNTQTAMVQLYFLYEEGSFEKSGALAVVVLVITFAALAIASRLFKAPLRQVVAQ